MTGTLIQQVGAMSAQKCAYTSPVHWTPETIRREREARGWSQRQLRDKIVASAPDAKISLRAVTAWELDESKPSRRNIAALERVFATDETSDETSLADIDDLDLLAEVARRMAAGRSQNLGAYPPISTPGANQHLRWDAVDMPSAKRSNGKSSEPDTKDQRA